MLPSTVLYFNSVAFLAELDGLNIESAFKLYPSNSLSFNDNGSPFFLFFSIKLKKAAAIP